MCELRGVPTRGKSNALIQQNCTSNKHKFKKATTAHKQIPHNHFSIPSPIHKSKLRVLKDYLDSW